MLVKPYSGEAIRTENVAQPLLADVLFCCSQKGPLQFVVAAVSWQCQQQQQQIQLQRARSWPKDALVSALPAGKKSHFLDSIPLVIAVKLIATVEKYTQCVLKRPKKFPECSRQNQPTDKLLP